MKKIIMLLCLMILLAGCVATPEKVSIDSTVEAAISTAIAPYESRYDQFITKDDLKNFQDEQYTQIKNLIIDQMELYKSEVFSVPVIILTILPSCENFGVATVTTLGTNAYSVTSES